MKKFSWIDILKWGFIVGIIIYVVLNVKFVFRNQDLGNLTEIPTQTALTEDDIDPYAPFVGTVSQITYDTNNMPSQILITNSQGVGKKYIIENKDEFEVRDTKDQCLVNGTIVQAIPLDDSKALIYTVNESQMNGESFETLRRTISASYPYQIYTNREMIDIFGWSPTEIADTIGCFSTQADDASTIVATQGKLLNDFDKKNILDETYLMLNEEGLSREYICVDYSNDTTSIFMIVTPEKFEELVGSLEIIIEGFDRNNETMYFNFGGENAS